jgi:hypothetical protein
VDGRRSIDKVTDLGGGRDGECQATGKVGTTSYGLDTDTSQLMSAGIKRID